LAYTRKELKTDKIADEAWHILGEISAHPDQIKKWGAVAAVALVLIGGIYFYRTHQAAARQEALAEAMKIDDAIVSNNPVPGKMTFKTLEEMQAARTKAFSELAAKYSGSREGAIGAIYMASTAADKGNMADAEKTYKEIVDSAPTDYASIASLSLAHIYAAQGKQADAEKLLRDLMKNPTTLVSKEQATIELADILTKSNPAEARKLLEPLRIGRSAVSRAAVTMLGNLPQNN
jgi:predicted negative regulator of RcsB-dependent stress response